MSEQVTAEAAEADGTPEQATSGAAAPPAERAKRGRRRGEPDDAPEYEMAFDTPFGTIDFEVDPAEQRERRERRKRERAEAANARAAAKAARRAEKRRARADEAPRGHGLLIALLIFMVIAAAVALAVWLFARPGEEEADAVPEAYRSDDAEPAAAPQGVRARVAAAVRAGRRASREAQQEQERRFREMTRRGGGPEQRS